MNLPVKNFRVLLSLLLAVTVTTLCSLRVYASNEPKAPASEPAVAQVVRPKPDNLLHTNGKVHAFFRNVALDQ